MKVYQRGMRGCGGYLRVWWCGRRKDEIGQRMYEKVYQRVHRRVYERGV